MKNVFALLFVCLTSALWAQPTTTIVVENHDKGQLKQAIFLLSEADGISVIKRRDSYVSLAYNSEQERLAAMAMLQSHGLEIGDINGIPVDFPILPANATQEQIDSFADQKLSWVANNPERYEKMIQYRPKRSAPKAISAKKLNSSPTEKQPNLNIPQPDKRHE